MSDIKMIELSGCAKPRQFVLLLMPVNMEWWRFGVMITTNIAANLPAMRLSIPIVCILAIWKQQKNGWKSGGHSNTNFVNGGNYGAANEKRS
ncbi:hypothetical protein ACV1EB_14455 [Aeromonas caviae]